jgi:hypothetical protein
MSMGVYIDMEMPKSCDKCSFFAWKLGIGNHCALCPDVTFHVIIDGFDVSYERNGKCPLIEVPEPHGRLGDLDAAEALLQETLGVIPLPLYKILKSNTVIPASNEG